MANCKILLKKAFLRIGHRGACAHEPENTLRSLRRALALGVNAVEFDVRATRDRALVLMHDARIDRTTNGKGLLRLLTLRDVQRLRCKDKDGESEERVPTLAQALRVLRGARGRALAVVELKEFGCEEPVVAALRRAGMLRCTLVVSFIERSLERVKELCPVVATGLIYALPIDAVTLGLRLKCLAILPHHSLVTTRLIKEAHDAGLRVFTWTVNNALSARRLYELGVDGVASDRPEILRGLR